MGDHQVREVLERGARQLRVRSRPLRRNPLVRQGYQNVRYGWFTARNGLWRVVRSRRSGSADRSMTVNTYEVALGGTTPPDASHGQVLELLTALGVETRPGFHTVYVPPGAAGVEALSASLAGDYPEGSGLKLMRDAAPVESASYLTRGSNSALRKVLTGSARDQLLAANLLHSLGLGPRVWDVCTITFRPDEGQPVHTTAFVMEHVEGTPPAPEACEEFMDSLDKALAQSPLQITMAGWRRKPDFDCPDCNGNLLATDDGSIRYVDFQNFAADRGQWLDDLATRGTTTHFGRHVPQRGGKYLYQAIPGVDAAAKRSPEQRWDTISAAVEAARPGGFAGRLVIDVGCNAGVMSHYALTDGAHWAVGLDKPDIAAYADELLLALGSSRHTVVPGLLGNDTDLPAEVPPFLRPRLDGSIVLYLAVRDTMGIMPSLTRFGWEVLVYEGHQGETLGESREHLAPLLEATGAEVASATKYSDGDSTARSLLILVRPPAA